MSLFRELKRRNVFRVGAAYVVVAWLVIQVVATIFPAFGFGDAAVRIGTIVLAIGLVPALIFSWAFELTPEGLKKEKDVDRSRSISLHTGKKLDRIIMVVLALALGYFAFDKFVLTPQREAAQQEQQMVELEEARQEGRSEALVESYGDNSIAVLPFVNMSDDANNEYFSDGISEELLHLLARIPELRVISRTSAFAFKGDEDISIPELARKLNVSHILEGSVRKSGDDVRITAQLIEAHSDTHLWSKTYDRGLDDIFAIQDEIAQLVVDGLKVELLGDMPKVIRTDPTVLTLVLQARRVMYSGTEDRRERAIALLEEALRIDPDYIPALHDLGSTLYYRATFTRPFEPEAFERAMKVIVELNDRAIAIAPDDGLVLIRSGWRAFEVEKDFQKAADLIELAMAAAPGNEEVLSWTAYFARVTGHFDLAISLKQQAMERNLECPHCVNIWNEYLEAQRYDEAIEARLAYAGQTEFSYDVLVQAALLNGDAELALEYATQRTNSPHVLQAMALHSLGRSDEALAEFSLNNALPEDEKDLIDTAKAALWLGDEEGALDLLYQRYWPHMHNFYQNVLHPVWEPLHDHPRWLALREKSGRTVEAYASIKFAPKLSD